MTSDLMYEYTSAANPKLSKIPILFHRSNLYKEGKTRIIPFDNSKYLNTFYPSTTPSLLASFVKILKNENIHTQANATSHFFYVVEGKGYSLIFPNKIQNWGKGDIFVVPPFDKYITHYAEENSCLLWVTDEPLLQYLGVTATLPKFQFTFFPYKDMIEKLNEIKKENAEKGLNRLGILLGNNLTENTTKTITHTLWSLLNILPANTIQKPHRHNSVALDLCILNKTEDIYTLVGEELDEYGNIKNPVKCCWESGTIFITPPGLWHSHHNESLEEAYVLPVQDAGLYTYLRTLDIRFS